MRILNINCAVIGLMNQAAITVPEMFRVPLLSKARYVALVHNHPSGQARPSDPDEDLLRDYEAAARRFGMEFLYHIVIGEREYGIIERGEEGVWRKRLSAGYSLEAFGHPYPQRPEKPTERVPEVRTEWERSADSPEIVVHSPEDLVRIARRDIAPNTGSPRTWVVLLTMRNEVIAVQTVPRTDRGVSNLLKLVVRSNTAQVAFVSEELGPVPVFRMPALQVLAKNNVDVFDVVTVNQEGVRSTRLTWGPKRFGEKLKEAAKLAKSCDIIVCDGKGYGNTGARHHTPALLRAGSRARDRDSGSLEADRLDSRSGAWRGLVGGAPRGVYRDLRALPRTVAGVSAFGIRDLGEGSPLGRDGSVSLGLRDSTRLPAVPVLLKIGLGDTRCPACRFTVPLGKSCVVCSTPLKFEKAHIRAYTRRGPAGQLVQVKEHEDIRRPRTPQTLQPRARAAALPGPATPRREAVERTPAPRAPMTAEERALARRKAAGYEPGATYSTPELEAFVKTLRRPLEKTLAQLNAVVRRYGITLGQLGKPAEVALPYNVVGGRLKGIERLREKLAGKWATRALRDATDIAGARVICRDLQQLTLARKAIERHALGEPAGGLQCL